MSLLYAYFVITTVIAVVQWCRKMNRIANAK
jgi:hypothetical protein